MDGKIRVYLAEDQLLVREGLKLIINSQPDMVVAGEDMCGEPAWHQAASVTPDLVVMETGAPDASAIHATRYLKEIAPSVRVLVLTTQEDWIYLRDLIQAGASGYVLKRATPSEFVNAIHVVVAGGVYLDPSLMDKMVTGMVDHPGEERLDGDKSLSLREREVVRLVAQGYTNREIASALQVSVKTVETYKRRAMDKLGLHSRADFFRFALKNEWLAPVDGDQQLAPK
jgi:DNA-binding NarL/FixJ family response regulator